jgi:hypothetical protein
MANPQPQQTNTPFDFKIGRLIGAAPALQPFQMGDGVLSRCKNYLATADGLKSFGVTAEDSPAESPVVAFTVYGASGEAYCVVAGAYSTWFRGLYSGASTTWTEVKKRDGSSLVIQGNGVASVADTCTYFFSVGGNYVFEAKTVGAVTVRSLGLSAPDTPTRIQISGAANKIWGYRMGLSYAEINGGALLLDSGVSRANADSERNDRNTPHPGIRVTIEGSWDSDTEEFTPSVPGALNANMVRVWSSEELYSVIIGSTGAVTKTEGIGSIDQLYLIAEIQLDSLPKQVGITYEYELVTIIMSGQETSSATFDFLMTTDAPGTDNLGDAVGIEQIGLSPIPPSSFGAFVKERIFVKDNENPTYVIYSSQQGTAYREQMNALQRINVSGTANVVCFGPINDDLAIFTEDECYIVSSSDPANGCQFLAKHGAMGNALFSAGRGVFIRNEDGQFRILSESSLSFHEIFGGVAFCEHMGTVLSENDRTTVIEGHPNLVMAFAQGSLFVSRISARDRNKNFILNFDEECGWTELDIENADLTIPFAMDGKIAWLGTQDSVDSIFTGSRVASSEFALPLANENGFVRTDSCDLLAALDGSVPNPSPIAYAVTDYGRWGEEVAESSNPVNDSEPRWYRFVLPRDVDKQRPCGRWMEIVFSTQQPQQTDIFDVGMRGLVLNPWMHPEWDPLPKDTAFLTFGVASVDGLPEGYAGTIDVVISGDGYEEQRSFTIDNLPPKLRFVLRKNVHYVLKFVAGDMVTNPTDIVIARDTLLDPIAVLFPYSILTAPVASIAGLAGQTGTVTATLSGNNETVQKTFETSDVPTSLRFTLRNNTGYTLAFTFDGLAGYTTDVSIFSDATLEPIVLDFGLALLTAHISGVVGMAGATKPVVAVLQGGGEVSQQTFMSDATPVDLNFITTKNVSYTLSFESGVDYADTTWTGTLTEDTTITLEVDFMVYLLTIPIASIENGDGSTVYADMENLNTGTKGTVSFAQSSIPLNITFTLSKNEPYELTFRQGENMADNSDVFAFDEDTTLDPIAVAFTEQKRAVPVDFVAYDTTKQSLLDNAWKTLSIQVATDVQSVSGTGHTLTTPELPFEVNGENVDRTYTVSVSNSTFKTDTTNYIMNSDLRNPNYRATCKMEYVVLQFRFVDSDGIPLANATVTMKYTVNGQARTKTLLTNYNGEGGFADSYLQKGYIIEFTASIEGYQDTKTSFSIVWNGVVHEMVMRAVAPPATSSQSQENLEKVFNALTVEAPCEVVLSSGLTAYTFSDIFGAGNYIVGIRRESYNSSYDKVGIRTYDPQTMRQVAAYGGTFTIGKNSGVPAAIGCSTFSDKLGNTIIVLFRDSNNKVNVLCLQILNNGSFEFVNMVQVDETMGVGDIVYNGTGGRLYLTEDEMLALYGGGSGGDQGRGFMWLKVMSRNGDGTYSFGVETPESPDSWSQNKYDIRQAMMIPMCDSMFGIVGNNSIGYAGFQNFNLFNQSSLMVNMPIPQYLCCWETPNHTLQMFKTRTAIIDNYNQTLVGLYECDWDGNETLIWERLVGIAVNGAVSTAAAIPVGSGMALVAKTNDVRSGYDLSLVSMLTGNVIESNVVMGSKGFVARPCFSEFGCTVWYCGSSSSDLRLMFIEAKHGIEKELVRGNCFTPGGNNYGINLWGI